MSPINQLYQVKQEHLSLWDYISKIKHLNARCELHELLSDEHLLPKFLLGLKSKKLHDSLFAMNPSSFKLCSKIVIKLGDKMMET